MKAQRLLTLAECIERNPSAVNYTTPEEQKLICEALRSAAESGDMACALWLVREGCEDPKKIAKEALARQGKSSSGRQLDRVFIGQAEYVRADEAEKAVTSLQARLSEVSAALKDFMGHWEKCPMWNPKEVNASVERARAALAVSNGEPA